MLSRTTNILIRLVALAFAVTVLPLGGIRLAEAHNVLESSIPARGASVATGPSTLELAFNEPVEPGFNEIAVLGPDKVSHWENGPTNVEGERISVALRQLGPAGVYTVSYHIVSDDGHPVSGSFTFILTAPGSGTPATAGEAAVAPQAASPTTSDTVPIWVWLAAAATLLTVGAVVAYRIAR